MLANKRRLIYTLITVWALFTVTLLIWWLLFGLEQLGRIAALTSGASTEIERHRTMLIWEGGALVVLVVLAAAGLIYYVRRELDLLDKVKIFFATFAHELKTPLSSLRLHAESLLEGAVAHRDSAALAKIVRETARLNLQLENSLLIAGLDRADMVMENVRLSEIILELKPEWPDLEVSLSRDCILRVDRKALHAVLRNLVQNAIVHGKAQAVTLEPVALESGRLAVAFEDDGGGFKGEVLLFSKAFHRPYSGSGNGMGLYLINSLLTKMNGKLELIRAQPGFRVSFDLAGEVL